MQPLFVFSLPRSGSTLAQKILAGHPSIATVSEPWLLLPMLYALRRDGALAEYNHQSLVTALDDFCREMPGGRADYLEELRRFVLRLYARAAPGDARYFLDKTPRYHLLAHEIHELFPEGRFVYLWRNPLAVVASMIDSFCAGKWRLHNYRVDLFRGLDSLLDSQMRHRDTSIVLRYEDFVSRPETEWRRVFDYLDLEFDPRGLERFGEVALRGTMGDSKIKQQPRLSTAGLERWQATLANPVRKAWCRRWLRWIGRERLREMGYDLDELLRSLRAAPTRLRGTGSDLIRMPYAAAHAAFELALLRRKVAAWSAWPAVHPHT